MSIRGTDGRMRHEMAFGKAIDADMDMSKIPGRPRDYRAGSTGSKGGDDSVQRARDTRGKVLVIDDDAGLMVSLEGLLGEHFEVATAQNIGAAYSMLSNGMFDVVLTDFELPDASGLAFLDHIRDQHPNIVGILMTGHAQHPAVQSAQNNWQRCRVILKPYEPATLLATIKHAVGIANLRKATHRLSNLRRT